MAIAVASTSTAAVANGPVSITKPTGVAVDDCLLIILSCGNSSTITTPSGFTLVGTHLSGSLVRTYAFIRLATSSDVSASSYSVDTATTGQKLGGIMMRVTGVDRNTMYAQLSQTSSAASGTSRSHTVSVSPTYANSLLIAIAATDLTSDNVASAYSSTGSPTWTEVLDQFNTAFGGSTDGQMAVAYAPYPSTTTITNFSWTTSSSTSISNLQLFILRPQISGDGSHSIVSTVVTDNGSNVSSSTNVTQDTASITASINTDESRLLDRSNTSWTNNAKSLINWTNPTK